MTHVSIVTQAILLLTSGGVICVADFNNSKA